MVLLWNQTPVLKQRKRQPHIYEKFKNMKGLSYLFVIFFFFLDSYCFLGLVSSIRGKENKQVQCAKQSQGLMDNATCGTSNILLRVDFKAMKLRKGQENIPQY